MTNWSKRLATRFDTLPPMAKRKTSEPEMPKYEQAVELLEQIIERIESGEIGLEQSIEQYEQGMKLIKHCRSVLDRAESTIKKLSLEDEEDEAADTAE